MSILPSQNHIRYRNIASKSFRKVTNCQYDTLMAIHISDQMWQMAALIWQIHGYRS